MKRFLPLHAIIFLLIALFSLNGAGLLADDAGDLKKDLYKAVGGNDITQAQETVNKLVGLGTADAAEVMFDLASHRNAEKISYDIFQILLKGLSAMAKGHLIGVPKGDVRQLSGVFIIDTDGDIRYSHYAKNPADHPGVDEILGLLE